jgi:uncharacterized protein YjbI with pentapeptide repeats
MANEEQLNILRQGVGVWNTWRRTLPLQTRIDLSNATLKRTNLSGVNLGGTILNGIDLSGTILSDAILNDTMLSNANLSDTIFSRANLRNAILTHATLQRADLIKADLSYADLSYADLSYAYLNNAILNNTILSNADLSDAILSNADLSDAILSNATLSNADLSNTTLSNADLSNTTLSNTNLSDAILSNADLSNAILFNADLRRANFNDAILRRANFTYANLSDAIFSRAILSNAILSNTILHRTIFHSTHLNAAILNTATMGQTVLVNLDLRNVKGLETIKHTNPSTIGTDTLELSGGLIPETFLRNIGMSNIFLKYTRSQAQSTIQYYTCFISYSSKDELFAQRLHNDLQQEGVRCWFAPEDMKIGDKIRMRIEESIQMHDKLLLILSKHAIESDWVEYEVEAALTKEQHEKRTVLFPVRLDDAIVTEPTIGWAAHIQNTRHIGNFECWKDQELYIKAFNRLLRDLKADTTKGTE